MIVIGTIYMLRATALAKLALDKAGPELLASLDEGSYKKIAETIGIMEENLKLWEPTSPNSKGKHQQPCISIYSSHSTFPNYEIFWLSICTQLGINYV